MNKVWWKEAVAYQIYPRSFMDSNGDGIGDLQGIISKLDYLKDLGVDVLWVCPFFKSPNDDNGYDISDYQDIMEEFGTMDDFDQLLKETHARGMKLILDLVINHTSDEHPWFIESRASQDSPKRDWYIWRDGKDGKEPNNWESIFSGPAWEYDEKTEQYYMHIFSVKQPDLNWENPDVRHALYDTVNWWLDKGIDGFRVDAISHIKKVPGFPDMPNPTGLDYVPSFDGHMNREGIQTYLKELKENTFDKYDIMTVGEANGVTIEQADDWVGEENGKFNMIFQFEHLGLWDKGGDNTVDVRALKETLSKWQKGLENRGWNALFFENHDQPRSVSTWGNDAEYRVQSAKMLGACYFFMQGTPYIYQGQEIGMTNVQFESIEDYNDVGMKNYYRIETAKGVPHEEVMEIVWKRGRDNSRTPMQWSDATNAGFSKGKPWMGVNPNFTEINVEHEQDDPNSVLSFYKDMIRLRKEYPQFVYGEYELLLPEHEQIFAYTRSGEAGKALVICNFSPESAELKVPAGVLEGKTLLMLQNYPVEDEHTLRNCTLKPYEARVYVTQ
ncbi:alpha-glucosidase [Paenibacillus taihuensis]|uniref:Alpha-amylase n=1 Tax=Paenibacillus taihuensis TaxID=1156355 RepID=A0A3D9S6Y1_9BACL|nr:alpha-glucosidase [Paenibacillus taihuensis]REE88926.1 alpha-glucosidase [Paenibacillus taihuensis]